jgi:copper/zinc superoxide dismutase (SODC)
MYPRPRKPLAGKHGFHVHEKGDCPAAMKDGKMEPGGAAGAHYDPAGKKLAAALAWITKMTGGIASRPSRCLPMASD